MSRDFDWDEDLEDFLFDTGDKPFYRLFDYETLDVLAKIKFKYIGIRIVQTKMDIFYADEGSLDYDIFEVREDEPIYIFKGINNWQEVDWEIDKVMEVLEVCT